MARETVEAGFPKRLSDGYKAFFYGRLRHERERMEGLATAGQRPEIMIIACCDSRAAPEVIFDAAPGERVGDVGLGVVGAADDRAALGEHPGQAGHAAPADSDEVGASPEEGVDGHFDRSGRGGGCHGGRRVLR